MKTKNNWLIMVALVVVLALGIIFYLKSREKMEEVKYQEKMTNYNIELLRKVQEKHPNSNYLISPYSIYMALNMLRDGANGNTKEQINNLIGEYKIKNLNIKNQLSVANGLFIKNSEKDNVLSSYTNNLKNNYDADILYDDFDTPEVINTWVKEKTNGMIEKILDSVNKGFVLGLANAIALDAKWKVAFDCTYTDGMPFTKSNGSKINTEMMHREFSSKGYHYFETTNAKGVIMPYESKDNNSLEFIGILPNDNVNNYIKSLTQEELNMIDKVKKEASNNLHINIYLPRFTNTFDLNDFKDILKELGIVDAFDGGLADFSNIITNDNIYVSDAIHKTYIDLNESGTKAAAVTYFGLTKSAVADVSQDIIDIKFDKPFVYMIRDVKTKEIIFVGTVDEPNTWKGTTCTEGGY